ncbi:phosphatidate cytidylyltransferase [Ruicaihuangia caeni]|uniref:Phosphatidate cytidylyltransferase n=1 Tax=Ruicaihuangia caeni TaxID=3042517 RepID=A0AAW6T7E6_9MICO|nr:phosphatidate cytidylyltransferase [Klugiella sp. YN-L-19]MDI2097728.1 phosphatidate cytidylyltransferase [Klugiella sp. YN-L-19]
MRRPDGDPPTRRRARKRTDLEALANDARAELESHLAEARAHYEAIEERIEKRTGRNLIMAILIGLALGALLLFSLLVFKELFMLFAAALLCLTAFELASALRFSGRDVPRAPVVISAIAIVPATFYLGAAGQWLAALAGMVLVTVWRLVEWGFRRAPARDVLHDLGAGLMVLTYVPFLGSFAVLLAAQPDGQWWTLAFLIVVVSCDTGAYATGLTFGRHPMAPRISPKKTWEGFAGSVAAAIIAGVLLALFMIDQPWWVGVLFGIVLTATGTLGDLAESMLKRDLGIKDISSWLPGHGGFLDRLDSVLPSAVAATVFYLIFA